MSLGEDVRPGVTVPWRIGVAALLLLLTLLPLAEWIGLPRRELRPGWESTIGLWAWGTAVVLGVGLALQILSRDRVADALGRAWTAYLAVPDRVVAAALGLWVLGSGVLIADVVFARNPGLVDSVVQLFQAKIFAAGRLWAPAPAHPEFFLTQHTLVAGEKFFSQFPPGHPAVVALALRLGLPAFWVSPVVTALAGVFTYLALRRVVDRATANLCALLLALSPFFVFMAGEQMNHGTALLFLAAGFYLLVRGRDGAGAWAYAGCGAALGLAFATRPLDAVAWAAPLGVLLIRERRWRGLAAVVAGGLPVAALVFAYNGVTTGHPFTFGYTYLWRESHRLGFHTDPWGDPYTPVSAVGFLNLDFRRLSLYSFEWPVPLALFWAAALVRWPREPNRGAVALIGTAVAVIAANFFYWHHGLYLGPRMLYTAIPGLVLLAAIGLRVVDGAAGRWRGTYRCALLAAFAIALILNIPARTRIRIERSFTMKLHPEEQARTAGIENAVIFVAESWASRMLTRLLAWGVPPSEVERSYRALDSCEMDEILQEADGRSALGADSSRVREWIRSELAERRERNSGIELPKSDTLPDPTVRLDPTRPPTPRCRSLIAQDFEGFTLFTPFLPLNVPTWDGDLVFARHFRERDTLLARLYPERSYYVYTPLTATLNVVPRFVPLVLPAPAADEAR